MPVLVVDKPSGPTSFEVVRQVRRALMALLPERTRRLKVGHGGTLDPLASGALPICVGEATKIAPFLLDADKEYQAAVRFGVETDTHDAQGRVVAERPVGALDRAAVERALAAFRGPQLQVPPMHAAIKRAGRPLYEYARAGQEVERAARPVTVHALELMAFEPPAIARLHVRCSKGTYVRVLAADLGRALGCGAHLTALRRTRSGPFSVDGASPLDVLLRICREDAPLPWVSIASALGHLPRVGVSDDLARTLTQGRRPPWEQLAAPSEGPVAVLGSDGAVVAVAHRREDGTAGTWRVFGPDPPIGVRALQEK